MVKEASFQIFFFSCGGGDGGGGGVGGARCDEQ